MTCTSVDPPTAVGYTCICVDTYVSVFIRTYVHAYPRSMSCGCDSLAGVMLFAIANLLCYCFLFNINTFPVHSTSWGPTMEFVIQLCSSTVRSLPLGSSTL